MTDKIHPAIEVVARSMFESDTLEPEREPNLWIEYIPDAKKHIASFLDATREPSEDMEVAIHEARDLPVWRIYQIIHDQIRREILGS